MRINRRARQSWMELPLGPPSFVEAVYEAVQVYRRHCPLYQTLRPPQLVEQQMAPVRLMGRVSLLCQWLRARSVCSLVPEPSMMASVLNTRKGELLWLPEGWVKDAPARFVSRRTPVQRDTIAAVAIDRRGAYLAAVDSHALGADMVFDNLYLTSNLGELLDNARLARGLIKAQEQILNFCTRRLTSAHIEASNPIVSCINHWACGVANLTSSSSN